MSLSSNNLDAFVAVCKSLHFSKASQDLHITQSALSQRIKNLEEEVGQILFLRDNKKVTLTDSGIRLLRYCQTKDALEAELCGEWSGTKELSGGTVRIAGYSSIMASVVIPSLSQWTHLNPGIHFSFMTREVYELESILQHGEADWIFSNRELVKYCSQFIGNEDYVLIESAINETCDSVYLDHDGQDESTEKFFKINPALRPKKLKRSYFDDIYTLLQGVVLGYGRAVVPRHLLTNAKSVRIIEKTKPMTDAVYLHWHDQPAYSRLHREVTNILSNIRI